MAEKKETKTQNFNEELIKECKEVFELFDQDGSGTIDADELEHVLRSLGQNPSPEDIKKMLEEVDKDGNGVIDFYEFMLLMERNMRQGNDEQELKEIFDLFDRECKGNISHDDLAYAMECLGEKLTSQDVDDMISVADVQSKGSINFTEFMNVMLSKAQ